MRTLRLDLGERSYPIYIGSGLLPDSRLFTPHILGRQVLVVSNVTVAPLYRERLESALQGFTLRSISLPDGEAYKTLDTLNLVYDALLESRFNRRCTLIALGGGVVGDICGFAAASYQRGVDFIQVPTTLLSQVDSSVGGKTGVNHRLGKNMIGAFHQPVRVVCDLATLATLPDRELRAGLAEVIKYGPIADAAFLDWIEAHLDALLTRDAAALAQAVRRSCEIKAAVVGADEREAGLRAILNFGHTFGHAIEAGLGYGQWLHGEAVACGMVMAARLSVALGLVSADFAERLRALVQRAGLPVVAPDLGGAARWLELMRIDKKAEGGEIRFVVIEAPGRAALRPAPDALVARVIEDCRRA